MLFIKPRHSMSQPSGHQLPPVQQQPTYARQMGGDRSLAQSNFYPGSTRHSMKRQRDEFMSRVLKERVPSWYLLVHSLLLMMLGVALIALETVGLTNNIFTNRIYAGFWCGAVHVLLGSLSLLFVKVRTFTFYRILVALYSLLAVVGLIGLFLSIWLGTGDNKQQFTWLSYTIAGCDLVASLLAALFTGIIQCLIRSSMRKFNSINYSHPVKPQQQSFQQPMFQQQPQGISNPNYSAPIQI